MKNLIVIFLSAFLLISCSGLESSSFDEPIDSIEKFNKLKPNNVFAHEDRTVDLFLNIAVTGNKVIAEQYKADDQRVKTFKFNCVKQTCISAQQIDESYYGIGFSGDNITLRNYASDQLTVLSEATYIKQ